MHKCKSDYAVYLLFIYSSLNLFIIHSFLTECFSSTGAHPYMCSLCVAKIAKRQSYLSMSNWSACTWLCLMQKLSQPQCCFSSESFPLHLSFHNPLGCYLHIHLLHSSYPLLLPALQNIYRTPCCSSSLWPHSFTAWCFLAILYTQLHFTCRASNLYKFWHDNRQCFSMLRIHAENMYKPYIQYIYIYIYKYIKPTVHQTRDKYSIAPYTFRHKCD